MKARTIVRGASVIMLAGMLGGCAGVFTASIPDEPGLYAVLEEDKHLRLHGDAEWERETWAARSNLPRNVHLIVVHPALADKSGPIDAEVRLWRVAWVRSEIDASGRISPPRGPEWSAPNNAEYELPLRFSDVEGAPQAVAASPEGAALEPGLYSVDFRAGTSSMTARFGVQWPSVDRTEYGAANCVDRYTGGELAYRACAEQRLASRDQGLRVYLVDPEQRVVDGRPGLVLKGTVVNLSGKPRRVPMLEGSLRNKAGQTLHKWRFSPPVERLKSGASASFQVVAREVPHGTARAFVGFASAEPISSTAAGR